MESWVGPGNKAKHSLYVGMCSLVPRLRPDGKLGGAGNEAKHNLYVGNKGGGKAGGHF